jgi:hypothetical protein
MKRTYPEFELLTPTGPCRTPETVRLPESDLLSVSSISTTPACSYKSHVDPNHYLGEMNIKDGNHSNAIPLQIRSDGNLAGKGIYLSFQYNWDIVEDDLGAAVLIPSRKD